MNEYIGMRYLYLVNRKLDILTSGLLWKSEYNEELISIDKELSELRILADEKHKNQEVG